MNQRIITIKILVTDPTNNPHSFSTLDTFKTSVLKTINDYTEVRWKVASIIQLLDEPDK
jgi:hypothetical protein